MASKGCLHQFKKSVFPCLWFTSSLVCWPIYYDSDKRHLEGFYKYWLCISLQLSVHLVSCSLFRQKRKKKKKKILLAMQSLSQNWDTHDWVVWEGKGEISVYIRKCQCECVHIPHEASGSIFGRHQVIVHLTAIFYRGNMKGEVFWCFAFFK